MSSRWISLVGICCGLGCSAEQVSPPTAPLVEAKSAIPVKPVEISKEAAEKELLAAIAIGDLKEVQRIAVQVKLREIINFPYYVLASPNADVVRFLRDEGQFNISDLQIAAIRGDVKVVDHLLAELTVDQRRIALAEWYSPFLSHSPLRLAIGRGHTAVVQNLIRNGANVDEVSRYSLSPLANAAEAGNREILKLLLEAGADINTQANDGYTALMRACIGGQSEAARVLLEAGADPNLKRHDGRRALHFAAMKGDAECVKLLLKFGADVEAIAYGKDTALSDAESGKHDEVVRLLKEFEKD